MSSACATTVSPAFLSVAAATALPHKSQLQLISYSTINNRVLRFPEESIRINVVNDHNKHARSTVPSVKLFASTSSPSTPAVEEVDSEEGDQEEAIEDSIDSSSTSASGCQACGKEEIERGCNGEGRIQGGIATVPGFGWWPIKAYRPCPSYLATGGRYRRTGQSMDEIGFGGGSAGGSGSRSSGRKASSAAANGENAQMRKRKFRKLGSE